MLAIPSWLGSWRLREDYQPQSDQDVGGTSQTMVRTLTCRLAEDSSVTAAGRALPAAHHRGPLAGRVDSQRTLQSRAPTRRGEVTIFSRPCEQCVSQVYYHLLAIMVTFHWCVGADSCNSRFNSSAYLSDCSDTDGLEVPAQQLSSLHWTKKWSAARAEDDQTILFL